MNDVPISLLHALFVFSQSRNLTVAAEKLGLSQPGLSKQLRLLEDLMPQDVFTMSGKNKVLTAFGEALANEVGLRLAGLPESLSQVISEHSDPRAATVRIAGRREILDRFSDQLTFPGRIVFSVFRNGDTARALLNRKVDFGVTWLTPDTYELIAKKLFVEKFQVIIPKSLMLTKPSSLKQVIGRLETIPCLTYKEDDEIFHKFCRYFGSSPAKLTIHRTTANYQNLTRMIALGFGWSIVPAHYEVLPAKNWILPVPEAVELSRQFFLCYRRETAKVGWSKLVTQEIEACFS